MTEQLPLFDLDRPDDLWRAERMRVIKAKLAELDLDRMFCGPPKEENR